MHRPLWLLLLVLSGCWRSVRYPGWPTLDPVVDESSGLVASRVHPGVFWTHNDSGDVPRVFAVGGDGRLLGTVDVEGASAVDWEDVALDTRGRLWLADLGNNDNTRRDLVVYAIAEPEPVDGTAPVVARVGVRYPDQTEYPGRGLRNFDGEALFWADETLWVATKHRSDRATTLYRFPALEGDVVLERVGAFELGGNPERYGGMATAADLHPSGRYLALLTYHALFVFEHPEQGHDWLSRPVHSVAFDQDATGQCEAVAWDGWSVVITNEDGAVQRIEDPFRQTVHPRPSEAAGAPSDG